MLRIKRGFWHVFKLVPSFISPYLHHQNKLHPEVAISEMMRVLKANSSKWIRTQFEETRDFAWQTGYGAFSVSESQASKVRDYIQSQKEHHLKIGFNGWGYDHS